MDGVSAMGRRGHGGGAGGQVPFFRGPVPFGDRMARNKSPGSIGQRSVNVEADKEKETCSASLAPLANPDQSRFYQMKSFTYVTLHI